MHLDHPAIDILTTLFSVFLLAWLVHVLVNLPEAQAQFGERRETR